ncbi:hypothetical protein HKX48_003848 [Thoreauomyces humboldtii]|nr:hypothetical protein HKX48_003848 [Thoreauomyces humboldtii]
MPSWMPLVFNIFSARPHNQGGFAALFYIAFSITFMAAALTIIVGTSMKGAQMKVIWPLQALRLLTTLISTILLIPIVEIFVNAIACYDYDSEAALITTHVSSCFTATYIPPFVLGIVGVLYLTLEAPTVSTVFFTINPGNKDPHAKTTGRIDALYNLLRISLSVFLGLGESRPQILLVAIILASASMIFCMSRYQPFFVGTMNDVRCGIFCASLGAGIQSAVVYAAPATASPAPFIVLCLLLVPEFAAGFLLCRRARFLIGQGVYARLKGF